TLIALTSASAREVHAQGVAAKSPTVVTLITGDRVALSSLNDGRPVVAFEPAAGPQAGSGYQTLMIGAHVFVIPLDAAGYLAAPLDLSLFDVTALAAAGYANPSIPLALDVVSSGSTISSAALPTVTILDHGKGIQARADARRFGQALSADRRARQERKGTRLNSSHQII